MNAATLLRPGGDEWEWPAARGWSEAAAAGPGDTAPAWELPLVDTATWIGREPPARRWIVDGWLARGTGALLVGEDGVGKSLVAQQLATCVAAGRPFLGLPTVQVPTLYLTCEDDADELHRRQRAINRAAGLPVDCAPAMLSSLVGALNIELGAFDPNGKFVLSPCFDGIAAKAKAAGVGLIVLDNVAHLFPGNENVRREVAAFCSALDRLAIECDATVLMLAHPNKGGAEYSGSTGWSAHVRQRWFMERPEPVDGLPDRDARVLRKSKANYSEAGVELAFRWYEWAFVQPGDLPPDTAREIAEAAAAANDNALFLACLAERNRQRRAVSDAKASRTYAPKEFAAMPEAKGVGYARLEAAMDRLFRLGVIDRGFLWREDGKDRHGLREVHADVPPTSADDVSADPADLAADLPPTCSADLRRRAADVPPTPALTHPPYYVREGAAPLGAAAPSSDPDQADSWASGPDDLDYGPDHTGDDE